MPGEIAAAFSAIVALGSVSLNLWGGILSERKRADLQKEVGSRVAPFSGRASSSCTQQEQLNLAASP